MPIRRKEERGMTSVPDQKEILFLNPKNQGSTIFISCCTRSVSKLRLNVIIVAKRKRTMSKYLLLSHQCPEGRVAYFTRNIVIALKIQNCVLSVCVFFSVKIKKRVLRMRRISSQFVLLVLVYAEY